MAGAAVELVRLALVGLLALSCVAGPGVAAQNPGEQVPPEASVIAEDPRGDVGGMVSPPATLTPAVDLVELAQAVQANDIAFALTVDELREVSVLDSTYYRIEFRLGSVAYRIEVDRVVPPPGFETTYRGSLYHDAGSPGEFRSAGNVDVAAEGETITMELPFANVTALAGGSGVHLFENLFVYDWHAYEYPDQQPDNGYALTDRMPDEGFVAFTIDLGSPPVSPEGPASSNNTTLPGEAATSASAQGGAKDTPMPHAVLALAVAAMAGRRLAR
jgi:hypothetical protein